MRPATILVVDDDADSRTICEIILSRHGYRVVTAMDGESGLRLAETEGVSAIVLDVALPGVNGWTFIERLRRSAAMARVPVILYTAHSFEADRERGLRLGCAGYLVKPCSPRLILKTVQGCLEPASEGMAPLPMPA